MTYFYVSFSMICREVNVAKICSKKVYDWLCWPWRQALGIMTALSLGSSVGIITILEPSAAPPRELFANKKSVDLILR